MRIALRSLVVLAVFAGVGVLTERLVLARHGGNGVYQPEVKLGAEMAGLFAGGGAALVTLIVVLRLGSDRKR